MGPIVALVDERGVLPGGVFGPRSEHALPQGRVGQRRCRPIQAHVEAVRHLVVADLVALVRRSAMTATRQCGRCRETFDGDPSLSPTAIPEWWLCQPCRAVLLRDRRAAPAPAATAGQPFAEA